MDSVSFRNESYIYDIARNFHSFYKNEMFCDCILSCDGRNFKTHRIVLASSSDYFRELFQSTKEFNNSIIIITDIEAEILEGLLEFVYKGSLSVPTHLCERYYSAGQKLKLSNFVFTAAHPRFDNPFNSIPFAFDPSFQRILPSSKSNRKAARKLQEQFLRLSQGWSENADYDPHKFLQTTFHESRSAAVNEPPGKDFNEEMNSSAEIPNPTISGDEPTENSAAPENETAPLPASKIDFEKLLAGRKSVVPPIDNNDNKTDDDEKELVIDEGQQNCGNASAEAMSSPSSGNSSPDSDKENMNYDGFNLEEENPFSNLPMDNNFFQRCMANLGNRGNNFGFNDANDLAAALFHSGENNNLNSLLVNHFYPRYNDDNKKRPGNQSGEKFQCEVCNKTYAWKSGLYKHRRSAHGVPTKKENNDSNVSEFSLLKNENNDDSD